MENKITIAQVKEIIRKKKWLPFQGKGPDFTKMALNREQLKWLNAILKIMETDLGMSVDEFQTRFGYVAMDAMRNPE